MLLSAEKHKPRVWLIFILLFVFVAGLANLYAPAIYPTVLSQLIHDGSGAFADIQNRGIFETRPLAKIARHLKSYQTEIPHLYIDIKFKHYEKLRRKREKALEALFLLKEQDDFVPARIRLNDQNVKVKLRLKGDFVDHLETEKWSFRIQVKKENTLFGMRRFSLQSPHTKNYHYESLFLDHMRKEDLLALRYFFVDVTLNGKHIGIMAVEEHFSKELLEAQGRREDVIAAFDETDLWQSIYRQQKIYRAGMKGYHPVIFDNWKVAKVKIFNQSEVSKSEALKKHADLATAMLRGLTKGLVKPSDIFNVDRFGKFLAICELWGAYHPVQWNNMRFYLDPFTLKLEPIGFDGNACKWDQQAYIHHQKDAWFCRDLLQDPVLREAYLFHYRRLIRENYLNELEHFLKDKEKSYTEVLYREFPALPRFDFNTIRLFIKRTEDLPPDFFKLRPFKSGYPFDDPAQPSHSNIVYASLNHSSAGYGLELLNPVASDVLVTSLTVECPDGPHDFTGIAPVSLPVTLPPNYYAVRPNTDTPWPVSKQWQLPDSINWEKCRIKGTANIHGQDQTYSFHSRPSPAPATEHPLKEADTRQNIQALHPFLKPLPDGFEIPTGTWDVSAPLEIPRVLQDATSDSQHKILNPRLEIQAGTVLRFSPGAYLRISGPLMIRGEKARPAVLQGQGGQTWPGIVVCGSPSVSSWSWVTVRNTRQTMEGPWMLTGGTTFYYSNVDMDHVRFVDITSEDALNIAHSKFDLKAIGIETTVSDGIDCDFSEGRIAGGHIRRIEGDGVDVSGSRVWLEGIRFDHIHDKAVSVGEKSELDASGLTIDHCSVAVASKDGSSARITSSHIRHIGFAAYMAYNKKSEFGPSTLVAEQNRVVDTDMLCMAQKKHTIIIDHKKMYTMKFDVNELYESGFMKKQKTMSRDEQ